MNGMNQERLTALVSGRYPFPIALAFDRLAAAKPGSDLLALLALGEVLVHHLTFLAIAEYFALDEPNAGVEEGIQVFLRERIHPLGEWRGLLRSVLARVPAERLVVQELAEFGWDRSESRLDRGRPRSPQGNVIAPQRGRGPSPFGDREAR